MQTYLILVALLPVQYARSSTCDARCTGANCTSGFLVDTNQCYARCYDEMCSAACYGDKCISVCTGLMCKSGCDGEQCVSNCTGLSCHAWCTGSRCQKFIKLW